MAITAKMYGKHFVALYNKEIEFDADTMKVALTTSSYTPNQDTHDYFDDVTNEVLASGYTTAGATLGSKTVTYTAGTNKLVLDGADVTWPSSTITARYAVLYDASPSTNASRPLFCYVDFGTDVVSNASTFTITWSASGIVEITVA